MCIRDSLDCEHKLGPNIDMYNCWFQNLFKIKVLLCLKSYPLVSSCINCFASNLLLISCFIPLSVPRSLTPIEQSGIWDSLTTTHNCYLEYNEKTCTCISNVVINKTNLMNKLYQSSSGMNIKKTKYTKYLIIQY